MGTDNTRKVIFRRIAGILLSFVFFLEPPAVYAQIEATTAANTAEATSSAAPPFEASPTATPSANPAETLVPTFAPGDIKVGTVSGDATATEAAMTFDSPTPLPSASIRQPPHVRALAKRTYRAAENITVVVDNAQSSDVRIAVFNSDGQEVRITVNPVSSGDPAVFTVEPQSALKAGRYRVKVTDPDGKVTVQDFTWGVLAINTDKSIYLPKETAHMQIAVLDDVGLMVCDAKLTLTIDTPSSGSATLSTEDKTIIANPECSQKKYTEKPDYETSYTVGDLGTYTMTLTAETAKGIYTIRDGFDVREHVPFDILRNSSTRIYPPASYPMKFTVKFANDFTGDIEEVVPGNFAVSPAGDIPFTVARISRTPATSEVLGATSLGFVLPFDGQHPVSLGFGEELKDAVEGKKYADFGLLGHDGIDFDMPEGTPILAVDDGTVVKIDPNGDYGTTVVLQHEWGKSYYGHLSQVTTVMGAKIAKGHPFAMSGNTGLSTGAHLHFGIKLNVNDKDNGYYGKVNPWPYLASAENVSAVLAAETDKTASASSEQVQVTPENPGETVQVLTWHLSAKAGETKEFGYAFTVPNISPQFYLLGPLTIKTDSKAVFSQTRQWQLAIDADGSGTNSVNPTTGTVSATDQTYTFTFTATETMDSGEFTISVPSGWTAPQTSSNSTAGYTTSVGNSNATVANVFNNADSTTGWTYDDTDFCQLSGGQIQLETSLQKEGSGAIICNANGGTPDAGDSFGYDFAAQNWTNYTQLGVWLRSDDGAAAGVLDVAYDNQNTCASPIESFNGPALTADTWTYAKFTLTAARTSVTTYCFIDSTGTLDADIIYVDELLIGPGTPTVTGSGPWTISTRILDVANTETFSVVYGDTSGSANGDVTNSASSGVHTFTTQSKISTSGTLTNIGTSPTVDLSAPSGPTTDQLLRHGAWFNASGVEQPFTF